MKRQIFFAGLALCSLALGDMPYPLTMRRCVSS